MRFLARCFGRKEPPPPPEAHALVVRFKYGTEDLQPIFEVGQRLETALQEAGAGDFDGNEIATDFSDGSLYMYGPDGERLLEVAAPILESCAFLEGAHLTVRYGPPSEGVRRRILTLGP